MMTVNSKNIWSGMAFVAAVAVGSLLTAHRRKKTTTSGRILGVIQCQCGCVRIQIDAPSPVHIICYCDDCQNYEIYCRQQRKSNGQDYRRVADKNGGVRVCQVYKTNIRVLQGNDLLRPTAIDPTLLNDKPPFQMFRFHSDCCQTPLISASWKDLSVVGFFVANFLIGSDEESQFCMATSIMAHPSTFDWYTEDVSGLPPIQWRINKKYAKHPEELRRGGWQGFPPLFILGFLWRNFVVGPSSKISHPLPFPPKGKVVIRHL
ncbi:hypothetical protein IV203_035960 [Nitzschia inconspicua]|uniref:Uncharacterized protein n=1 Tax=Nitzschia inconspicua TaxID=303405 RepID=A0A9K3LH68_9STRA|nr:hypothetical protein IV203_035960 [Nitzschia inconspicua]